MQSTDTREQAQPRPPWEDTPPCPKCNEGPVLSRVLPEYSDGEGVDGMPIFEELDALNDCDVVEWAWCMKCDATVEVGAAGYARAKRADDWWDREDREEAWAELQRQRKIDAVAADHARRQLSMFGGAQP